jgi:hypothetical protein
MMTPISEPVNTNRNAAKRFRISLRDPFRALRWGLVSVLRKVAGRFIPLQPSLHVIGDSHAKFIFRNTAGIKVHYLGPVTMHRVARDGRDFLRLRDLKVHDRDVVVWCLGEIDVRCHILHQSRLQNSATESIVRKLAETYLLSIAAIQRDAHDLHTVVLAVIPPTDQVNNEEFPRVGSLEERIEARQLLNEALRENCAARSFHFLDPFSPFTDPIGALKENMSDGNVHCGPAYAPIIVDQVTKLTDPWLSGA